ncbi:MAG: tight adherence protein [Chloroflexota bacterium]|jgi:Flp pilus assembly protein TadB|nr:tight adherence protein [Chloroflexota bacterium]
MSTELVVVVGLAVLVLVAIFVILGRGRARTRKEKALNTDEAQLPGETGKKSPRAKAAKARKSVLRLRDQTRRVPAPGLITDIIRKTELYNSVEAADAGYEVSLEDVARMKLGLAGLFAILGILIAVLLQSPLIGLLAVLGGAVVGFMAPDSTIKRAAELRQTSISRALPLAMDVIGLAVERSTIDAGISYYVEYFGHETLAEELHTVLENTRIRKERLDVAMGEMLRKNHNDDLTFLVAAVGQATTLGGTDLRLMLTGQADELRLKREQVVKEKSLRAPVMMTFPTMLNVLALLIALGGLAALQLSSGGG